MLGFDGGCGTCSRLARELVELSAGQLTARSLRSAEVGLWREQALGAGAPWAPTLFAVAGDEVQAWTGSAMAWRLTRLLGVGKMWQVAQIMGDLMDRPMVADPGRRRMVRQGFAGAAAGFALLAGGAKLSPLAGLAQEPTPEPTPVIDPEEPPIEGDGSRKVDGWSWSRIEGGVFDRFAERARSDRPWRMLFDYFEGEDKWVRDGRAALQFRKEDRFVRKTYLAKFKNRESGQPANVIFGVESGGKTWAIAHVFRQNHVVEHVFVQNGNLRTRPAKDAPDVQGDAGAAWPGECTFGRIGCLGSLYVSGPNGCVNQCGEIITVCGGGGALLAGPGGAALGGMGCGYTCTSPCVEEKAEEPGSCVEYYESGGPGPC